MKKKNLFIFGIFLFLLAFACSREFEHAPPVVAENHDSVNFDAVSAQAYFETNATDLAPLRFSDSVSTRSVGAELIPEWDKAMVSANSEVQIVEVPIRSNRAYISIESVMENGKLAFQKFHITRRRLVVARQRSGNTAMFVITLHPSATAGGNPDKSIESFRYLSGGDFVGLVFCSTPDGRYVEAREYTGQQISPVKVSTRRQWMEHGEKLDTMSYQAIQFSETIMTRAATYSSEECEVHGSSICNCLDEAIVIRCQKCGGFLEPGEKCSCGDEPPKEDGDQICVDCHFVPCTCEKCPFCDTKECGKCKKCHSLFCYGSCTSGGGGGGGNSGGGNAGGGGGLVPPVDFDICPFSVCHDNPCSCCALCRGRCKCSGCHRYPCVCCPGRQCPKCYGYQEVGPRSKSSACPRCSCIEIIVSVSSKTVELGEEFQISVSVNPASARCNYIEFNMSKDGDEKMLKSFNANPSMSIEEMMRQPGKYEVTVIAQFDGYEGIYESKSVVLTGIFPHVNKIVGLPVVKSGMNTAWELTKANADKEGMQEFGGVVTIHTQPDRGELYSFDPCEGDKGPYEPGTLEIVLHPTDNELNDFRNGGSYAVMLFHTHPPYWNSPDKSIRRELGPSLPDKQNITTYPAVVYDFDNSKFTTYTPNTPREQCQIKPYIYGPERRIN